MRQPTPSSVSSTTLVRRRFGRVAHGRLQGGNACGADVLRDEPRLACSARDGTDIDCGDGGLQPTQGLALRIVAVGVAGAAPIIGLAGGQHPVEALRPAEGVGAFQEIEDGRRAQLVDLVDEAVIARRDTGELAKADGDAQTLADGLEQIDAAFLVPPMARQDLGRRGAFAQVVTECGKPHAQIRGQPRGHVDHQHDMNAGVDLRMPLRRLGYAPEAIDLGEQPHQCAALAQHLEEPRGSILAKRARQLLPDPLRDQGIDLPGRDHLAHQVHGLGRDTEAEVVEAGREAGETQDPDRVFREGRGDMAQDARLEVRKPSVGIDQDTGRILGERIDGEVPALQVLLEGDLRVGVHGKAVITGRGLALGARQGVLVLGLWMEKDREVLADLLKTAGEKLIGCRANHDEITLADRASEQTVAHGAADQIDPQTLGGAHGEGPTRENASAPDPRADRARGKSGAGVAIGMESLVSAVCPVAGLYRAEACG
ncbi:hypothetical protein THIOKS11160003 [Thiocapsa sp. KS1]|nr:hypothetical protein THIOKS11160003 [Thiocapsa sp. KS1]